jgi:hypothetical protein
VFKVNSSRLFICGHWRENKCNYFDTDTKQWTDVEVPSSFISEVNQEQSIKSYYITNKNQLYYTNTVLNRTRFHKITHSATLTKGFLYALPFPDTFDREKGTGRSWPPTMTQSNRPSSLQDTRFTTCSRRKTKCSMRLPSKIIRYVRFECNQTKQTFSITFDFRFRPTRSPLLRSCARQTTACGLPM